MTKLLAPQEAALPASQRQSGRQPIRGVVARRLRLLALPVALMAVGLLFPFPLYGRFWNELFNLAHAPAFFLATLGVVAFLDPGAVGFSSDAVVIRRMSFRLLFVISCGMTGLGLAAEFLQRLIGRSASLGDAVANTCGVCAAFCLTASFSFAHRQAAVLRIAGSGVLFAAVIGPILALNDWRLQKREFPILTSLERRLELKVWQPVRASLSRTQEWSKDGAWSLRVVLRDAKFSGASLAWPEFDWTGCSVLQFDARNPGSDPLPLTVKVHDLAHRDSGYDPHDRFEILITLPAGEDFRGAIPVAAIVNAPATRTMNLKQICRVEFFVRDSNGGELLLDNIRLLRD